MELIGILLPAAVDLINQKITNSNLRFWVSVLICSLVGAFLNWIATGYNFENAQAGFDSISKSILSTFGIAQISYKALWEKSEIRAKMIGQPLL